MITRSKKASARRAECASNPSASSWPQSIALDPSQPEVMPAYDTSVFQTGVDYHLEQLRLQRQSDSDVDDGAAFFSTPNDSIDLSELRASCDLNMTPTSMGPSAADRSTSIPDPLEYLKGQTLYNGSQAIKMERIMRTIATINHKEPTNAGILIVLYTILAFITDPANANRPRWELSEIFPNPEEFLAAEIEYARMFNIWVRCDDDEPAVSVRA